MAESTERTRTHGAQSGWLQRLRAALDHTTAGVGHVAHDGRWILVNDALCGILGYAREQLLSTTFRSLICPEGRDSDTTSLDQLFGGEIAAHVFETSCARGDGAMVWIHLTASLVPGVDQEPGYLVVVVEDISDRGRSEGERARLVEAEQQARYAAERAADRTARVQAVMAGLAEALTPGDAADVVVNQGLACMGANAGSVSLITDDGTELEVISVVGMPRAFVERWRRFPLSADVPVAEAARTGRPVWIESLAARKERYKVFSAVAPERGIGAIGALPFVVDGRSIGALGLNFPDDRVLDEDDRAFMLALAHQYAQAIERTRLYQAERTARAAAEAAQWRLSLLAEVSAVLAASLDYQEILDRVAHLVVPVLADWCIVHTKEDDGTIRRIAVAHVDPEKERMARDEDLVHPVDPNGKHPIARVMRSGKGAVVNDIPDRVLASTARDERHLDVLRSAGFSSGICVPLIARDRILGTLTLMSSTPGRRYSQDDFTLADVLARRAALAADNARLYREAQEALAVREEFLTSISHDLRTPLTSAKGFAQLLQRRLSRTGAATAPEVLSEGFQTIDASLTRMATLVGQLLDLSRLQTGRPLDLERGPTDLVALAERAVMEHTSSSDRDQIVVESDLDDLVGFWDAARLERVLGNLLSNAIKYSPQGGAVSLRITRRPGSEEGEGMAVLTVEDQGIGIRRADLPRVFDRFYRGSNVVGRIAGTGIGMAGARQIVEQHGGSIAVESAEGVGSTFTVTLPLAALVE